MTNRHRKNGDYLGGKYIQDKRMILIDRGSRKDIEEVVYGILKENNGTFAPEFEESPRWWRPRELSLEVKWRLYEAMEASLSRIPLAIRNGKGPLKELRKATKEMKEDEGNAVEPKRFFVKRGTPHITSSRDSETKDNT